jgi:hypothetical protein
MHGENLFAKNVKQILQNFVIDVMKKVSPKLTEKKQKRTSETNFQKTCPPTLAKLIETSNLLPPKFDLPSLKHKTGNAFEQPPEVWTAKAHEEMSLMMFRLYRQLESPELREDILMVQTNSDEPKFKVTFSENKIIGGVLYGKSTYGLPAQIAKRAALTGGEISERDRAALEKIKPNVQAADTDTNAQNFERLKQFWEYVWHGAPPLQIELPQIAEGEEYFSEENEEKLARAFGVVYEAINRYEQFNDIRVKLRRIAKSAKKWNEGEKTTPFVLLKLAERVNFRLDEKGFVSVEANAIAEAMRELQAAKLEVARIRECEICRRIFFAGRLDKQSCSKRCQNNFNVRNSRRNKEESGEAYNIARRKKRSKI